MGNHDFSCHSIANWRSQFCSDRLAQMAIGWTSRDIWGSNPSVQDWFPVLEVFIHPVLWLVLIARVEQAHRCLIVGMSTSPRGVEPLLMTCPDDLCNYRCRNHMYQRMLRLKVHKTVKEITVVYGLMLLIHRPAPAASGTSRLHLDESCFTAAQRVHENVDFLDTTRRLGGKQTH